MDITAVLRSQYFAALDMLQQAIEGCPEELWDAEQDETSLWRVAYHALFYTHLYLQPSVEDFRPFHKHWEGAEQQGRKAKPGPVYARADLLEYVDFCRAQVEQHSDNFDPDAPSGFHWLPFSKLELQFYNIRHLQQHAGELYERLGSRAGIELHWTSQGA